MPSIRTSWLSLSRLLLVFSLLVSTLALIVGWLALDQAMENSRHLHQPHLIVSSQTQADQGELGIYLENRGHAPAKVTEFHIAIDDNSVRDWRAVTTYLAGFPIQLFPNFEPANVVPTSAMLKAGDRIGLYTVPIESLNVFDLTMVKDLYVKRIGVKIKYCSMNNKCWQYCRRYPDCRDGTSIQ